MVGFSTLMKGTNTSKIVYNPDYDYTLYPATGENLSYGANSLSLGWNYSMAGDANHYLWCLLRFVAQRVGKSKKIEGVLTKYINYDGEECFPVGECDNNGFRSNPEIKESRLANLALSIFCTDWAAQDVIIEKEMTRLGALWDLQA